MDLLCECVGVGVCVCGAVGGGGGATSSTNLDRIMKLQNKAQPVLCADFTTPSSDVFQELSWLSRK